MSQVLYSVKRRTGRGQALVEYGLVSTLVALVCMAALMLFGDSMRTAIANLLTGNGGSAMAAVPSGGGAGSAPPGSTSITTPDGTTINLSNYIDNIGNSVTTTGVNGTTEIMSQNILELAQQLLESGDITPEEQSLIIKLANQGHKIADAEKVIANAYKNGTYNEPITFDGQTYGNALLLSMAIGASIHDQATDKWLPGPITAEFEALQKQINDSGMISNPQAATMLNNLARNISLIADSVENATGNIYEGYDSPEDFERVAQDHVTAYGITNQDSAGICNVGSGQDSGTSCSKG